jgi:hypothetical protein
VPGVPDSVNISMLETRRASFNFAVGVMRNGSPSNGLGATAALPHDVVSSD